ncbi:cell division protein FtsH [Candidatus Gottesmanbacteria bacterium RIFCSPHIGHO2_01_FULL_47_48]|uniref:ATP-dependent zinc metalloprotease FtsH n=1 Tax=Candidatus Gottesmanbacteria bacterium RIFCSPHIGHO2_01_FULL_47_48 TaxID=1798381 RepID=A0A1F6A3G1_9BACT|nr:MAG: cell division protein FtsH [Candidatus Gottesmanbacteria bacterium RIFCSPHIGHO2_01_FULL_47_48]
MKFNLKDIVLYLVVGFISLLMLASVFGGQGAVERKPISEVLSDAKNGKVKEITVVEDQLTVKYDDGKVVESQKDPNQDLNRTLFSKDELGLDPRAVTLINKDDVTKNVVFNLLSSILPIFLIFGLILWMYRRQGGAGSIFSFGQSPAKLYNQDRPKITFADVAGVDEAKKELEEVVDFLKNPKKYAALGARTPKGVLLVGPSGTGKTLLAKAIAGEAGVPFFSMAGSEFMEMLVGVGASRARDLFQTAKKNKPAIIFIDEIDAIGRTRSVGIVGGHDEREQTLNQILIEMDGFEPNESVVVIGATNRGDLLDSALLRPGRFDRRVVLDLPDKEGRLAILKVHAKNKPFEETVDWEKVAKRTVGFSGADLENMLNEAAILAARESHTKISMADLEEAATKVKLGPQKKRLQSELDKKMTAYHEAGHAIVTHELPHMDPVHRISIVSRGMSLGHTLIPPAADRLHETKAHLLEQIASMLGGRAAEELVFGDITTGAASDISSATTVAREMVMEYGMSVLGPINFDNEMKTAAGRFYTEPVKLSEEMLAKIDGEVKKLIDEGLKVAAAILRKHRKILDAVAAELIVKETIDDEEFVRVVGHPKVALAPAKAA